MREKLILLAFGSGLGIALGLGAGWGLSTVRSALHAPGEGAVFETVDDLRAAIVERDERDVKPDKSVSLRSIIRPNSSDSVIYELKPNLDVRFQGAALSTNSFGMRGKEISKKKPKGVHRIAILGDSFPFGWGVNDEETFPVVLEQMLNARQGQEHSVEVLNFAVPGYSTFQQVSKFETFGIEFEPDVVLVYFLNNDFGLPFFIKDFNTPGALTDQRNFRQVSKSGKEAEKKAGELLGMLDPNIWLKRLAKLTKEKDIHLCLSINPRKSWEQDYMRLWVLNQPSDIDFVSLRPRFLQLVTEREIDPKTLALVGDPHPSPLMHGLLAEVLTEEFNGTTVSGSEKN